VNHAARQQEFIRARNAVSLGQVQLNAAMGMPAAIAHTPTDVIAERGLDLLPL
jgi:hypothetical protein